jgi:hypothetical protein
VVAKISKSMDVQLYSQEMRIKAVSECGGGQPKQIEWILSGAIDEFYQPGVTYVQVLVNEDTDEDFCKYRQYQALLNSSVIINVMDMHMDDNSSSSFEIAELTNTQNKTKTSFLFMSAIVENCSLTNEFNAFLSCIKDDSHFQVSGYCS